MIGQIDMSMIRLVNAVYFYDEKDLLIVAGKDGVFIYKFDYRGNYKPELAAKVDKHGEHISISLVNRRTIETPLEWCKGLHVVPEQSLVITWNLSFVSFNELSGKGNLLVQYQEPCGSIEKVLDVCIFPKDKYFLTATDSGLINVFRYRFTRKVESQHKLIHSFKGHNNAVTSVSRFLDSESLVISASLDATVRIWCLHKF